MTGHMRNTTGHSTISRRGQRKRGMRTLLFDEEVDGIGVIESS